MDILNRWTTAQQLNLPGAEKPQVPVELKTLKKPGTFETPEQVDYLESPDIEAKIADITKLREEVAAAVGQGADLVSAARAQAKTLETALKVPEKETKIAELLAVLHDGLVKLSGESTLMFRQANGLIVAFQKLRSTPTTTPSDKEKLEFIKSKLGEAGDLGKTFLSQLEEFSAKVKNLAPVAKDVVTVYPKPKLVKNQKEEGDAARMEDLIWSAGTSLATALKTLRDMTRAMDDASDLAMHLGA